MLAYCIAQDVTWMGVVTDCRLPVLEQQCGRCKAQVGQPWLLPMNMAEMQPIVEGVAVKVLG